MIKNLKQQFVFMAFVMLITACGVYQPIEVVPDHIRTIRINPIKNETQQIEISTILMEEIIDDFVKEGRLTVVSTPEAHSSLEILIKEYSKIPISYDENLIAEEYKLTMLVDLKYNDLINQVMLWNDVRDNLTGGIETWVKYEVGTNVQFAETEEEARQRLLEDLSQKILHRTIYGWQ